MAPFYIMFIRFLVDSASLFECPLVLKVFISWEEVRTHSSCCQFWVINLFKWQCHYHEPSCAIVPCPINGVQPRSRNILGSLGLRPRRHENSIWHQEPTSNRKTSKLSGAERVRVEKLLIPCTGCVYVCLTWLWKQDAELSRIRYIWEANSVCNWAGQTVFE